MPWLDVSEVLFDPEFAERLKLERTVERVESNGVAVEVPVRSEFVGVVVAIRQDIQRSADVETVTGSISVITRTELQDGTQGRSADVVEWRKRRYTVTQVSDYSNYGHGLVRAVCELIPFSG